MKTIILTFSILIGFGAIAQKTENNEEPSDTTKFRVGTTEFIIINHAGGESDTLLVDDSDSSPNNNEDDDTEDSEDLTNWGGFQIGVNTLMNSKGGASFNNDFLEIDPAQSFNFSFNLMEKRIPFGTPHVGLVTGIGFTHSRYGFKNNNLLRANSDSTWAVQDSVISYNKNQLRSWYFNVPLMLQFNTSKKWKKNVYLSAGVIGGVRLGKGKLLRKYDLFGGQQKDKIKGSYNLNSFQLNATARVGYRNIGLFANYNLLPMFEADKSEQAFPLTAGITFGFN
jgi:hypothetical protein